MKNNYLLLLLTFLSLNISLNAQSEAKYLIEHGTILYSYSGNTEGSQRYVFTNFGNQEVVFTELSRNSTFYGVKSEQVEKAIEYFKDGYYYYFDLINKNGQVINHPVDPLSKSLGLHLGSESYENAIEQMGGTQTAKDTILGKECSVWTIRSKKLWIWNGILLKLESGSFSKKYVVEATKLDFDSAVSPNIFDFPDGIKLERGILKRK